MARRLHPRGLLVAVLLLGSLLLTGILALQAHTTFLYHRATAERVLRDYARLAAARFAQRTAQALYYFAYWPVMDALARSKAGTPGAALPAPAKLAAGLKPHASDFLKLARYSFRLDLTTGRMETAGGAPSAAARRWLVHTLRVHSRTVYQPKERLAAIVHTVDGLPRAIVYTVTTKHADVTPIVVGVEADPKGFEPFYTMDAEKFPLLPRPLTGGVIYDSLGSVIVTDASGVELYRSPVQYERTFSAGDTVETMMGGMLMQVALRPEMAAKLVIGGLPRSRLPLLLGVLTLTAGLIVTALVQLRREYELARLRADFVSGVSHELRTPLAQIRMFSETLLLGRVRSEDERRRSLEIVDQEARRLTHLVENLLHFSRSERQVTRLSPAPARLAPLVREAVEGFAPLATARGVTLRVEAGEEVVASVDADALRQMLLNLLDNAVKYGPPGQLVTVGVVATPTCARIWVDDEGPGIPPADRERVWDRFWRLERDRGSAIAGTGIGLAVVRELVALHGGRAWVEDAPSGARFVIELPLPGSAADETTGTAPAPAPAPAPAVPARPPAPAGVER
ncbi:MAG TPA: HAMP domain-containing sensor histidine kinase [Gemmatimonadales bacterium]|nr:HAMP domain-containing sensor histidine kinase [Gemmatimonadales bacterium]